MGSKEEGTECRYTRLDAVEKREMRVGEEEHGARRNDEGNK